MLNNDYTQKLLGLKDIVLENVEEFLNFKVLHIRMAKRIHKCPKCSTYTSKVHDYRIQKVKDINSFGLVTILSIRKRRHVCPCCNKRFYESISFLPRYQHTTNRLWGYILSLLSENRSMSSISKQCGVSVPTVSRIIDITNYGISQLPDVLSIDEFKGNAGNEKYQCIITNPKRKQVLDILPNRKQEALCEYFSSFDNRNNVKYVVMDMSKVFKSTATLCFPKAKIVADKYHVVRQVTWAFEAVRKRAQLDFGSNRRKYFKRSRRLLLKTPEKLTPDQFEEVSLMLSLSKELALAYHLKNEFYKFMKSTDVQTAKKALGDWYLRVGVAKIKEFDKCLDTFSNWHDEILNAFETGLTNGFTEGCNNRIKVLKRVSFGVKNFDRFRKRILHIMSY